MSRRKPDTGTGFLLEPVVASESQNGWDVADAGSVSPGTRPFCAIDFETYYTDTYSMTRMSTWEYVHHRLFNAFLVSFYLWDGVAWKSWVGHPSKAPWNDLSRVDFVSHNAGFDELVMRRLVSDGLDFRPPGRWFCTSDLSRFFQLDRGLARVAPILVGETADKTVRDLMKTGSATPRQMDEYALNDARICAMIWARHGHLWPERERFLSIYQRRAGYRGVSVDRPKLVGAATSLELRKTALARTIPWVGRGPVASMKMVKGECHRAGIVPPPSLSIDDPETKKWMDRNGRKHQWISTIREYSKCHQTQTTCKMMLERAREDGSVPFELLYRQAPHTARWQSGGGLRMQNLDKDGVDGVEVRHMLVPRPGKSFMIADLSQIEPRVLNWLAGDEEFLQLCANGQSPYEAHARANMGWTRGTLKKESAGLYALAKARVLALGYQAGAKKFVEMARTMAGLTVFEDEPSWTKDLKFFYRSSELDRDVMERARQGLDGWTMLPSSNDAVDSFRRSSPKITSMWYRSEEHLRSCLGRDCVVNLPDGGYLTYFDVREGPYGLEAWVVKNSHIPTNRKNLYGGKLVENLVQRVSRDVLADIIWRVARIPEVDFLWSVHDEIITEVPEDRAEDLKAEVLDLMHVAPVWAPGLPIAAEGGLSDHYLK